MLKTSDEKVSLLNLGGGAAVELFDRELNKVLKNIVDPNTEAKKQREVTLKVRKEPDEERFMGQVRIDVTSKTAAHRSFATQVIIGGEGGRVEARELVSAQQKLFEGDGGKVVPMRNGGEEG